LRFAISNLVGACTGRSAGFSPFNTIDISGCAAVLVNDISSVGDQAAGGGEEVVVVDRRQFVPGRKCNDQIAMSCNQWAVTIRPPFAERAKAETARSISA
jgi:hypothetical protein